MPCKRFIEFCYGCSHFQTFTEHRRECSMSIDQRRRIPECEEVTTTSRFRIGQCDWCARNDEFIHDMNIDLVRSDLGIDQLVSEAWDRRVVEQQELQFRERCDGELNPSWGRIMWDAEVERRRQQEEDEGKPLQNQSLVFNPYCPSSRPLSPIRETDQHTILSLANSVEEMDLCGICQDPFLVGQDIRRLPCGLKCVFHLQCLEMWLKGKGSCPLCRHRFNLVRIPDFPTAHRSMLDPPNPRRRRHRPSPDRDTWPRAADVLVEKHPEEDDAGDEERHL